MSHHFAFVDPSGTVVYPKGYPQGIFGQCQGPEGAWDEGITIIQHQETSNRKGWEEATRVNKLVYIGPHGALEAQGGQRFRKQTDLREQLATSGTGVSYNFETGIVTDKYGVKYKNGERIE